MKKILGTAFLIAFIISILVMSVRGNKGYPNSSELTSLLWTDDGPLELSPERGRFALTYSFVENNSLYFDLPLARFSTPDLGYHEGKYVSLFAPGVSFLIIPGYILGRIFDLSQVGSYLNIAFFGLLNLLLIRIISLKLGASSKASWLAGFTFLFATPAFTYSGSLFQHNISTFLILLSSYLVIFSKKLWMLFFVWFIVAMAIIVDNPNLIMMIPVIVLGLLKLIEKWNKNEKTYIKIKTLGMITFIGGVIPLMLFLLFNNISYCSPFRLSGTVTRIQEITPDGNPVNPNEIINNSVSTEIKDKTATGFFKSRSILNGLYIHLFSPDRSIIFYAPVIILGLLGINFLHKENKSASLLFVAICLFNITLYSLWGDPWGGWAFGSRYLVPSYAIFSIFLALALSYFKRNAIFILVFVPLFIYSVGVNTLGVLTSSRNPPFVEIANLELLSGKKEKYSFDRNLEFLQSNKSKSYLYNTYLQKLITAREYYLYVYVSILIVSGILLTLLILDKNKTN